MNFGLVVFEFINDELLLKVATNAQSFVAENHCWFDINRAYLRHVEEVFGR